MRNIQHMNKRQSPSREIITEREEPTQKQQSPQAILTGLTTHNHALVLLVTHTLPRNPKTPCNVIKFLPTTMTTTPLNVDTVMHLFLHKYY